MGQLCAFKTDARLYNSRFPFASQESVVILHSAHRKPNTDGEGTLS